MKHQPPGFAKQILRWLCHAELIEEIEGDLYELFQYRVEHRGLFRARLRYIFDVLHATNLYRSKPRTKISPQSLSVRDRLNHFFKIAFRNMIRNRTSALINLCGLAVSLASFLFISLYILNELTFDAFHPDSENVYRISYSFQGFDGKEGKDARAAGLWSVTLKESMPEVKQFTRFSRFGVPGNVWSENPSTVYVEQQFFWVDSTFTDIFALPLASRGDARKILADPHYVIISERIAMKYFGTADPIGKSITYVRGGLNFQFTVGAVMKNPASNTHFKPEFIANSLALNPLWTKNGEDRINSWMDSFSYSFIQLEPGADLNKVNNTLQQIFNQNIGEFAKTTHPILIPLHDLHFTTGLLFELEAPGDRAHLYIFASIGILILGMACINYMNLATARSLRRSKEVGLRKTLGVNKLSLIAQFLGESFLMTAFALLIALALVVVLLPYFNTLTLKDFSPLTIFQNEALLLLIGAAISVGILAGSYPAFYLSGFRPIEVLKGTFMAGRGPENFRKVLVVVQISITLLLLTGAYAIHSQLAFIDQTKLSEHKDQIITVRLGDVASDKISNYEQLAKQNHYVTEISRGPHLPRRENFGNLQRQYVFKELGKGNFSWDQADVDFNFNSMFHMEFITGRDFSFSNPADTAAIILNEAAVKELGVSPERALGLRAEEISYFEKNGEMVPVLTKHDVIGVVKDFNYTTVRKVIEPMAISGQSKGAEMMYIRVQGGRFSEIIDHLENRWNQVYAATPFQYWFMDEEFGKLYQTERQMAQLFMYLAGIAILIACLGLFGLASFTAEQKIKEIGIRKVLGATSIQILVLLTLRYVKLVLISFVVGIPFSIMFIHSWMQTFVYKADIGNELYIWTCLLILSITISAVGLESVRAARKNPADSIRHE